MFKNKKILITGGTGSLGNALTQRLLEQGVDTIRIFSRNESKQLEMESKFNDERLRFLIGDVRDYERLERAVEDIHIVFHAAAIKTNILGSQNVINACLHENIDRAICVGTDKAVSPLNTYGATKLLMEKLFVTAKNYLKKERHQTKFIALRYGNVLGSSGSVIPKFIDQIKNKEKLTITDSSMTRFSISMNEALDFILKATEIGKGSEIFVPKLKAYSILDVKDALFELLGKTEEQIVGIRPGEKLDEILINKDEMKYTWEYQNMYMVINPSVQQHTPSLLDEFSEKKKIENMDVYSSDLVEKIPKDNLKKIFTDSKLLD